MTASSPELNEATFRAAIEQAAVGIAQISLEGRFLTVNDRTCEILGYSRDELLGRTFIEITDPADRDADLADTQRLLLGEIRTHRMEKRYIHKDGQIVWASLAGSLVRHPDTGTPLFFVAVVEDITPRKQAEEALRASETRLLRALDATREGIWDWDITTGEVLFSPRWIRSLGYDPADVPARVEFWEAVVHPDDWERTKECLRAHLAGETDLYECENRLRMKSGAYRWNLDRGAIVERDDEGRPTRMVGSDTDITARRTAENALVELRRELRHADRVARTGTLAASLAHELNQPLAAILSNAQAALRIMAAQDPDLAEIKEILQDIVRDDRRAGGVIGGLRSMLRRQKTERAEMEIAEAIREVLDLMESEIVARGVSLDVALDSECVVVADKAQIQQVAMNFLMNALDAMDDLPKDRRRLHVAVVRREDARVRILVRDSGTGVAPDAIDLSFDPFWTTKTEGLGLGLAICREIIREHAGQIRLEPNDDVGVTAWFDLDCAGKPAP